MHCFQNLVTQGFPSSHLPTHPAEPCLLQLGALAWESGAIGSKTGSATNALLGCGQVPFHL